MRVLRETMNTIRVKADDGRYFIVRVNGRGMYHSNEGTVSGGLLARDLPPSFWQELLDIGAETADGYADRGQEEDVERDQDATPSTPDNGERRGG